MSLGAGSSLFSRNSEKCPLIVLPNECRLGENDYNNNPITSDLNPLGKLDLCIIVDIKKEWERERKRRVQNLSRKEF